MGNGYVRNDTANNIADGNVIDAADLDGEFDSLQAAFNASTGHTHDGTSAEGAPITVTGPAQEYVSASSEFRPKLNNTYDLGSLALQWKNLYVDGTAYLDAVDIDGGNIDGTPIGSSTAAAGSFTTLGASGNATVGGTLGVTGTATFGTANITNLTSTTTTSLTGVTLNGNVTVTGTVDGRDIAADGTKLDGIEAGATGDQTALEIKTAYESNANTNAFTDSEQSKLAGIEAGATADQSASEIKTLYESNSNTNAYTDAEKTKLAGIEAGADVTDTANVTAAGALMDSELTNITAVKALNQGVATTNSPTFAGLTTTANVSFGDNDKAIFGAGSDLQIFHDGSNSYINDAGTGSLYITGASNIYLQNGSSENFINAATNGAVTLYYDNAAKLATAATGVSVTGNVTVTGTVDGRDVAADGTKLDGIEAGADVTTSVKIASAGGLLASNNLSDVASAATARTNLDVDQAGTALALAIALG